MITVTVSALGVDTQVHRIAKDSVTLGRGNTNDVPLHGIGISRGHCRAFVDSGVLYVEDAGSTNGTVVQGATIESAVAVSPGMAVDVGECRVLFGYEPPGTATPEAVERTVAVPVAPPAAVSHPPKSSAAVSRVVDEVRGRQGKKATLARSPIIDQSVDRRATIKDVRAALDRLILDEAAGQFERELKASRPPSDAALALLKRMLLAEVHALPEDD